MSDELLGETLELVDSLKRELAAAKEEIARTRELMGVPESDGLPESADFLLQKADQLINERDELRTELAAAQQRIAELVAQRVPGCPNCEAQPPFDAALGSATEAALVPEVEREDGAEPDDFPSRFHRSLYGKSDNPEHAQNRNNREFLDGYAEGLTHDKASGIDAITDEWERRGSLDEPGAGFREWKRGFNAASLRRSWEGAREKASCSQPRNSQSMTTYPQRYVDGLNSEIAKVRGERDAALKEHGRLFCEFEEQRARLAKSLEQWEYFQGLVREHGASSIGNLIVQRDEIREQVVAWKARSGRLENELCAVIEKQEDDLRKLHKAIGETPLNVDGGFIESLCGAITELRVLAGRAAGAGVRPDAPTAEKEHNAPDQTLPH